MNISLAAASRADDGREKAELIALVKQVVRRRTCADACHTRNLVVEAGNLFRIIVDLINAGFNRGINLLILIAQILVGRFKLIYQSISFTDQRLACRRIFSVADQRLQAGKKVLH